MGEGINDWSWLRVLLHLNVLEEAVPYDPEGYFGTCGCHLQ